MKRILLSEIIYREDLYPRINKNVETVQKYAEDLDVLPPIEINQNNELIDGWHRWTENGAEISFKFAFPDVCPPSLMSLPAGIIKSGMFYPYGTVSEYFFELQKKQDIHPNKDPHVYFIQSENGGPIKIGIANNISQRLATLQTAHPYVLRVIGVIPNGGHEKEKELHERFAHIRLNGEWFEQRNEIMEVIHAC